MNPPRKRTIITFIITNYYRRKDLKKAIVKCGAKLHSANTEASENKIKLKNTFPVKLSPDRLEFLPTLRRSNPSFIFNLVTSYFDLLSYFVNPFFLIPIGVSFSQNKNCAFKIIKESFYLSFCFISHRYTNVCTRIIIIAKFYIT